MSIRQPELVVAGNLAEDIIFDVSHYGGSAGNIALNAARCGLRAGIVSSRGNDVFSQRYLHELNLNNVDTTMVAPVLERMPACVVSDALNHSSAKEWYDNGSTESLRDYTLTPGGFEIISTARVIHCTTVPPELVETLFAAKGPDTIVGYEPGPRIMHDPGYFNLHLFELSDLLFLNEEEAAIVLAKYSIGILRQHMKSSQAIIITGGPEGCTYVDKTGERHIKAESRVTGNDIVDSNGAGDAFRVGFYLAQLRGIPLEQTLELANRFGAEIVKTEGALLTSDSIHRLNNQLSDLESRRVLT